LTGPDGPTPVIGVASASAVPGSAGHRAAWHLFSVQPDARGWRIDLLVRGYSSESDRIHTLHEARIA
jgi:hypothetical protein